MPPPLAVIWRTWPQILSPFAIWAALSWLQGSFRFRLIPPSSPVACQVRLKVRQLPSSQCLYKSAFSLQFGVTLPYGCALCCHVTIRMCALLSRYHTDVRFVVTLPYVCALCCHIIIVIYILYIVSVYLIDTILSVLRYCFQFHISFRTGE